MYSSSTADAGGGAGVDQALAGAVRREARGTLGGAQVEAPSDGVDRVALDPGGFAELHVVEGRLQ